MLRVLGHVPVVHAISLIARGIEESKSRALDNLGRVYARQGNFKQAISCWETKLPLAKTPLETTWLYHEIGRCNLELGKHECLTSQPQAR